MHRQRGFVLLELMVGALVLTLLAVWGANTLARRMDETRAQATAVWMLSVRGAVQAYVGHYAATLTQADPSALMAAQGYADWMAPGLDELKANGLLANGFPDGGPLAGGADIRVMREGECPGSLCRLTAFIMGNRPLLRSGTDQVDEYMVAQWLMASKGLGGKVGTGQPQWLSGASFRYPNPPVSGMSMLPPGTVALVVAPEQSGSNDFLRVGDGRDPDFQGGLTVQGDVVAAADLRVGRNLLLGGQAGSMTACMDDGAITKDQNGGLLMCRNRMWQSTGRGGGGYSLEASAGCTGAGINPVTNDCSCPIRHNRVLISDSGPAAPGGHRLLGYLCVSR